MKKISIVFPLYNEEKRLGKLFKSLTTFIKIKKTKFFEFIFVDDGSSDNTFQRISDFIKSNKKKRNRFKIIKSKKNFGKGHDLKLGINSAKNEWILTTDADLSVSLVQILQWFKKYNFKQSNAYFGSRNHPKSSIEYKFYRKLIGNVLQFLVF